MKKMIFLAWDVFTGTECTGTVFFASSMTLDDVLRALILEGMSPEIKIKRNLTC